MKPTRNSEERNAETQAQLDAYPLRHTARTSAIAALRVAREHRIAERAVGTVTIKIEDLQNYLQTHHLRAVGGNPCLTGEPWKPKVFVVKEIRQ
jgi:hypothetical protein